ncbi:HIRAN domain-containing protein [Flavobacterium sp.]|uniref:HIRAN domain-containing protein n=1 Tax=Flavobacterium sp. TaxID=239 RepID=UPI003751B23A
MKAIGNIQLVWRPGKGSSRISIGTIKKNETEGVRFQYNVLGVEKAKKLGFEHYEGFPDTNKTYTENVLQIFGQRLIKSERTDSKDFYDFWNVDVSKAKHKFYMLAFTQGLLPTDNFEFLADFNPVKNLSFITEITNLTESQISSENINIGDFLRYELDPENQYDKNAVKVYKDDLYLGHIKLIHCNVFHKTKKTFKLQVQGIEKNGVLKRVFVKASL